MSAVLRTVEPVEAVSVVEVSRAGGACASAGVGATGGGASCGGSEAIPLAKHRMGCGVDINTSLLHAGGATLRCNETAEPAMACLVA